MDKRDFLRESGIVLESDFHNFGTMAQNFTLKFRKLAYHGNPRYRILSRNSGSKFERPFKKKSGDDIVHCLQG